MKRLTEEETQVVIKILMSRSEELWDKAFHTKGIYYKTCDKLYEESRLLEGIADKLKEQNNVAS